MSRSALITGSRGGESGMLRARVQSPVMLRIVGAIMLMAALGSAASAPASADRSLLRVWDQRSGSCTGEVPGIGVARVYVGRQKEDDLAASSGVAVWIGPDETSTWWEGNLSTYGEPEAMGESHGESTVPLRRVAPGGPDLGVATVTYDYELGDSVDVEHQVQGQGFANTIIVTDYFARTLLFSNATIRIDGAQPVPLTCAGMQGVLSSRYNNPTWVVAHTNSLSPDGDCTATNSPYFRVLEISTKGPYTSFVGLYEDHPEVAVAANPFTLHGRRWDGEALLVPAGPGEPTGELVPASIVIGDQGRADRVETTGEEWELVETFTRLTLTADVGGLDAPIHATCPVLWYQQRYRFFLG